MKIPKKLIFNYFTNRILEQANTHSILSSRLASMSVDFSFMLSLSTPIFLIVFIPIFILFGIYTETSVLMPLFIGIIPFSFTTFLILNKDFYKAKSIAKRHFGFQIVDIRSNNPASEIQCLFRNLTVIIWPIEVLFSMFNQNRRIGDFIAGTKLIHSTKENPELILEEINLNKVLENKTKLIWSSAIISLLFNGLSVLPPLLVMYW